MTEAVTDAVTVTVSKVTRADPHLAFEVFTLRMSEWWSPDHHAISGQLAAMKIEPCPGGRIWDENTEGESCVWGRVLTWEPGQAFAFSWLVGPDWAAHPEAPGSRVTVTFTPVPDGTLVTLVHDQLEAHGPGWEGVRAGVGGPGGWPLGLSLYVAAADGVVGSDR